MPFPKKKVVCYLSAAAADWGGASRVLFTNIRLIDRERFEPLLMLPSQGPIQGLLDQLGIRYAIWGRQHEPDKALQYARDVLSAARFFRRNQVDLLHINHANYWRPAEMIAAKLLRIPVVTHYHVVVQKPGPFVRYSSLIAAVSEYTVRNSEPKSVPKVVIHNSVNLKRFDDASDARAQLGLRVQDVVIGFFGQIRSIKGIDLFIRMAHRMRGEHLRFIIAGDCRDPKKYEGSYSEEQLRSEMGGDRRIQYVGYRSDIENLYRTVDFIVMPSRWGEPFGLINIEAGAARKPMICTRDGGIPEIIAHGENGFLVEREDLEGLTQHAQRLAEDHALRQSMGQRAREIVESRFTTQPVRKLEQAYDNLIERRRFDRSVAHG